MTTNYTYQPLSAEEIPSYLTTRSALAEHINPQGISACEEIGDGNLNYVYRVTDNQGRSLIIKQAPPFVRMTGEGWPMTPERARFEVGSLKIHGRHAPDFVVKVLDADFDRYIFTMEDLSDHRVWRGYLNEGGVLDNAAEKIGHYVAMIACDTSIVGLGREAYAANQAAFINTELTTITDDLVFTEPVIDIGRNSTLLANEHDASEFAHDPAVHHLFGEAKWAFMTRAEALIHGDLHTGSIMVKPNADGSEAESVKVFDSEFAIIGPVGFDLGAVIANFVIAAARAVALGEENRAEKIIGMAGRLLAAFDEEVRRRWAGRASDILWGADFSERRLAQWHQDAWMFAACKMARRVVGAAKTADLTTLPDSLREGADRGVLHCARFIASLYVQDSLGTGTPTPEDLLSLLRAARTNVQEPHTRI